VRRTRPEDQALLGPVPCLGTFLDAARASQASVEGRTSVDSHGRRQLRQPAALTDQDQVLKTCSAPTAQACVNGRHASTSSSGPPAPCAPADSRSAVVRLPQLGDVWPVRSDVVVAGRSVGGGLRGPSLDTGAAVTHRPEHDDAQPAGADRRRVTRTRHGPSAPARGTRRHRPSRRGGAAHDGHPSANGSITDAGRVAAVPGWSAGRRGLSGTAQDGPGRPRTAQDGPGRPRTAQDGPGR
jgi:hypothetical protein